MKTFILINYWYGAKIVHIYGTIQAPNAEAAAAMIGSKIATSTDSGTCRTTRHMLQESELGLHDWFLEEVQPITSRPKDMSRKRT